MKFKGEKILFFLATFFGDCIGSGAPGSVYNGVPGMVISSMGISKWLSLESESLESLSSNAISGPLSVLSRLISFPVCSKASSNSCSRSTSSFLSPSSLSKKLKSASVTPSPSPNNSSSKSLQLSCVPAGVSVAADAFRSKCGFIMFGSVEGLSNAIGVLLLVGILEGVLKLEVALKLAKSSINEN